MDFHETFISSASCGKNWLIMFRVQKVKGQGHSVIKYVLKVPCSGFVSVMDFLQALSLVHLWIKMN